VEGSAVNLIGDDVVRRGSDVRQQPNELRSFVVATASGRCRRAEALERTPRLDDLDRLVERHRADPSAPVRFLVDQALGGQLLQSAPDARPRDAVMCGQVGLDEPFPRVVEAGDDVVPELVHE
jgi:hypothetical protein